jgi:hypothetical protein
MFQNHIGDGGGGGGGRWVRYDVFVEKDKGSHT